MIQELETHLEELIRMHDVERVLRALLNVCMRNGRHRDPDLAEAWKTIGRHVLLAFNCSRKVLEAAEAAAAKAKTKTYDNRSSTLSETDGSARCD